jgi:beta-1,4-mannosyl-glycoprotein beta-1,4-N-acetylglucosaminyltransferase
MGLKYDIISLNNELDMLEIRLNILNDYVDYFVIVEATETFTGKEKPLYYELNKDRFEKFNHKIIHYVVRDTPKSFNDADCNQYYLRIAASSDNVANDHLCWLKEFYQKEMIKEALVNLNDDDICFISDLDEIWNYKLDFNIGDEIYKPMIKNCYINYLNVKTNEVWNVETNMFTGPIIAKYSNIKNSCLNHLRTLRKTKYVFIEDGGWHFNAIGGISKKIESFSEHPQYTESYMRAREYGSRVDESDLPEYLILNKEKYKDLFL